MEALLQSRILKSFKAYIRATPVALEAGDPEKRADEAASPGSPPNGTSSTGSGLAQRSSTSSWPFSSRPVSSQRLSSRPSSGRHGLHADGDLRNCAVPQIIQIKCEVMANWLYVHQMEHCWNQGGVGEGVVVKMARDSFTACPRGLMEERSGLLDAVQRLNVQCAMTVNTQFIKVYLRRQELSSVPLTEDLSLQIIPSISYLPQCQKHHFAAFIQDTAMVVVWDDDPRNILDRARGLQQQLMEMTWKGSSTLKLAEPSIKEKISPTVTEIKADCDVNTAEPSHEQPRKTILIQAVLTALTLIMVIGAIGFGFRGIAIEIKAEGGWLRLAFIAVVPAQIWLALFFMQSIAGCTAQIFGPTNPLFSNSKSYSGKPPRRIQRNTLPHVTIQCPVYKEGLHSVIKPTVQSVKKAIGNYEMQGGTANIFINDDGIQCISDDDAQARRDFYNENNIGWIARPPHNDKPTDCSTPFIRAGKFKKASNMNYALNVSVRIEEKLAEISRPSNWTQEEEIEEYYKAFHTVLMEDEGRTWGEGNVRIGDYILLIDSDTRVPEDCLWDAVSEMETSPEVAIIQFISGVMNVTDTFFEKGITFFTNLVYTAIKFAVANGDVAPFVGHNAILRWSAIQDIAYDGPDGREKYWSESTVSEDFDMALRLQCTGYLLRLGAYTGDGFKEGVSLTVYDELARWEKYAYGCSELIFHPIKDWIFRGPVTPLFRKFIFSNMPLPSKITIMAYVGTYYALASAFFLTLANYFIIGWFNGYEDHYYLNSFKIYFAIVLVFTGFGNVALAVLRYRAENKDLFSALLENFKWVPLLSIFLGGLSLHLFQAIFSHLFSINMTWGATEKEAKDTNFFQELPKVLKKFRWTFVICFSTMGMMIMMSSAIGGRIEHGWQIAFFTATWPLATVVASHVLLPTALNPGLMLFMW